MFSAVPCTRITGSGWAAVGRHGRLAPGGGGTAADAAAGTMANVAAISATSARWWLKRMSRGYPDHERGCQATGAGCHKVVTSSRNELCWPSRRPGRSIPGKPLEDPCPARALSFVGRGAPSPCTSHSIAMSTPDSSDPTQRDRSPARGMVAGMLLLSGVVLGALIGAAVGALVGAFGPLLAIGLFLGFVGGTAAVIVR